MSQPGWYPDPAGRAGHYRYWTGRSWASETTDAPPGAPAASASSAPGGARSRRTGILVLLAVLAVVLVIVGVLVVRSVVLAPPPTTGPGPLPSSTVTGGDDRTPDVGAPSDSGRPQPSSSTEPTPTTVPPVPTPPPSSAGPCPEGDPAARSRHPADDRIHGGDLSFPALPASDYQANPMSGFTFAYDMAGQSQIPGRDWFTLMGVGALNVNGFETGPRDAAETVLRCILPTAYVGSPVTERQDVRNRQVTVDGAPGWAIRTRAMTDDDPYSPGQLIEVIVLDTDAPEAWSFFYGAVRVDDADRVALLDQTVRSLQVS